MSSLTKREKRKELRLATALNEDGLSLVRGGDFTTAIFKFEKAVAIKERILGAMHPEVGALLNNVAVTLKDVGQYDKSAELYRRTLTIWEEVRIPSSWKTR
jgi:tetratricopeptide (TPR) repeat protein